MRAIETDSQLPKEAGHIEGPGRPIRSDGSFNAPDSVSQLTTINYASSSERSQSDGTDSDPPGSNKAPQTSGSHSSSPNEDIPKYFEVCVRVGEHAVHLGEINISSVRTDDQLFDKIWETYRDIRGSNCWARVRSWFLKPDDVFFVYVSYISSSPGRTPLRLAD
jgi:hypothetical protein